MAFTASAITKWLFLLLLHLAFWREVELCCRDSVRPRMQPGFHRHADWADNKAKIDDIGHPGFSAHHCVGARISIDQVSGPRPGGLFYAGKNTVTYRFSVGNTDEYGHLDIYVDVYNCSKRAGTFMHGRRMCASHCEDTSVRGSWCSYSCDTGYELDYPSTVLCTSRGWSNNGIEPLCKVLSCGRPSDPSDGAWLCDKGHDYLMKCALQCNKGYEASGVTLTTCEASKTWTHDEVGLDTDKLCRDVEDPTFPAGCVSDTMVYSAPKGKPTPVTWSPPDVSDNTGVVPNITYRIPGRIARSADPSGTFDLGTHVVTVFVKDQEGNTATCDFKVTVKGVTCSHPRDTFNNTLMVFNPNPPNDVMHGTSVSISCKQGFPQHGSKFITCDMDNATHTAWWTWPGGDESMRPDCIVVKCPELDPPDNGALSCFSSTAGTDCLMSCNKNFDIPLNQQQTSGARFTCPNSHPQWYPPVVPDCTVQVKPGDVRVHSDINFYYSGNCSDNKDSLRRSFVQRMKGDVLTRDACGIACIPENVQVHCGDIVPSGRRRRSVGTNIVKISFDVTLPHNLTPTAVNTVQRNLTRYFRQEIKNGNLTFDGLTPDENSIHMGTPDCDCPSGRKCISNPTTNTFSCVGCSRGHYMTISPQGDKTCMECPQGTYQSEEGATNCTLCPVGMSTALNGSHNITQCKAPGAGGWGDWGLWSECSQSCGGGKQHRYRLCDNPPPEPEGWDCEGDVNETRSCGQPFCVVDGGWGQWSDWSNCSAPCDGGETIRSRECDSPAPQHGGQNCSGQQTQRRVCNIDNCPVHGGWGNWTEWGECSASCGGGTQTRERLCENPFPAFGGNNCTGDALQTQTCNTGKCPECPVCLRPLNAEQPEEFSDGENKNCSIKCMLGYEWSMGFSPILYCGPNTDFVWSSYQYASIPVENALCAKMRSNEGGILTMNIPLQKQCTGDDPSVVDSVQQQLDRKMNSLPCKHNLTRQCNTTAFLACSTFTPVNRTVDSPPDTNITEGSEDTTTAEPSTTTNVSKKVLYIHVSMDGRLGQSKELTPGTQEYSDYVELMNVTQESVRMLTEDPKAMFTVNINGETVEPDEQNVDLGGRYICPAGTGERNGFCVDCPAGTYGEDSRCVMCPLDHYQDETMSTACKPCPERCFTYASGAYSISQCACITGSQTTTSQSTKEANTDAPRSTHYNDRDEGAVIGIAVGVSVSVLVVLVGVAVGVWCFVMRRKGNLAISFPGIFKMKPVKERTQS